MTRWELGLGGEAGRGCEIYNSFVEDGFGY